MILQQVRAWLRLALLLVGTLTLILGLLIRQALQPKHRVDWQHRYRRAWGRWCCWALGVRVHQTGIPPQGQCLVVTNHFSWLDPPALMAVLGCTLLSKAEVAELPIVGWGAKLVGIVFVQRAVVRSRALAQAELAATLQTGVQAAVFPEGTTSRPGALLPLQPGSFRLAAQLRLPVVLAYLHYPQRKAIWGEEPMAEHYRQVVGSGPTDVLIRWGPVLVPDAGTALRDAATQWLQQADQEAVAESLHY